jgi:2-dehydropantoate 2-reductase
MRQDVEARRISELELFAGTVLEYGKKHGIDTPVNREIFDRITELEKSYS